MRTELQFCKMKSRGHGWWWQLHKVMNAPNATEFTIHLKMGKVEKFILYVFCQNEKEEIHKNKEELLTCNPKSSVTGARKRHPGTCDTPVEPESSWSRLKGCPEALPTEGRNLEGP